MQIELTAGNVKSAMRDAGAVSSDLWKVPLDQIHILDGFNVRVSGTEYAEQVAELTELILANGFKSSKPLAGYVAVKDGNQVIYLTDGHRRFEAVHAAIKRGAEITALPVVVSPKGTSIEDLTVGLVIDNKGAPLTQYEVGLVCKRLIGYGWDEKTIAKRLNLTAQRVGNLLTLVASPASVRNLVSSGAVSATQAIDTIKKHGEKAPAKLEAGVAKAKAGGKSKATKKHIESKPTARAVVSALLSWAKTDQTDDAALQAVIEMAEASNS